jgi:hypothetical protein
VSSSFRLAAYLAEKQLGEAEVISENGPVWFLWCPGRDLNPHSTFAETDFKSLPLPPGYSKIGLLAEIWANHKRSRYRRLGEEHPLRTYQNAPLRTWEFPPSTGVCKQGTMPRHKRWVRRTVLMLRLAKSPTILNAQPLKNRERPRSRRARLDGISGVVGPDLGQLAASAILALLRTHSPGFLFARLHWIDGQVSFDTRTEVGHVHLRGICSFHGTQQLSHPLTPDLGRHMAQ